MQITQNLDSIKEFPVPGTEEKTGIVTTKIDTLINWA